MVPGVAAAPEDDGLRTTDTTFGESYFETLDGGEGYTDSTMWEDIAHAIKETFGIDRAGGRDISAEMNVLDVGCAKGYLVRHLRRRGFDAWGVDISTYALEHAPEDVATYLRWFNLAWVDDSHFGREAFRLVTCLETLEHIDEEHVGWALRHLYNLLVPEGEAVLTICVEGQPGWDTDPTHVTIRRRAWWERRLEGAGFVPDPVRADELRRFWLFSAHLGVFVVRRPLD